MNSFLALTDKEKEDEEEEGEGGEVNFLLNFI